MTAEACYSSAEEGEFERLPGLFRGWDLPQVITEGETYHLHGAGTTCEGTPLFALYRVAAPETADTPVAGAKK